MIRSAQASPQSGLACVRPGILKDSASVGSFATLAKRSFGLLGRPHGR